jgi:hypothetical protein
LFLIATLAVTAGPALGQSLPVPQPFPGAGSAPANPPARSGRPQDPPAAATPAQPPASAPAVLSASAATPPSAETLGNAPVYPAAEFLEAFDAGNGQHYYIFGTNQSYADIVNYYRNALRSGGREIFKAPATQQFDLGRYDEDRMAYPPSVVVKDYTWNGSAGYLFVSGTTETRYKTIIQIVPAAGGQ